MIISIHTPKAGGTTFGSFLEEAFGNRFLHDTLGWTDYPEVPSGTACIHGHFGADKYDQRYPNARLVTWLRDPVQRTISHYRFWLRQPDMANPHCVEMIEKQLSLVDFAAMKLSRNYQARHLMGKGISSFFFVGITELFEESLRVFQKQVFGTSATKPLNRYLQANPEKQPGEYYLIDPEAAQLIEEFNAEDRRLHSEAKEVLLGKFSQLFDFDIAG